jgi:hypothetical protein
MLWYVVTRERERRDWEAREEARIAAEADAASRREAHKAAIKELSAQTQVCQQRLTATRKLLLLQNGKLDGLACACPGVGRVSADHKNAVQGCVMAPPRQGSFVCHQCYPDGGASLLTHITS